MGGRTSPKPSQIEDQYPDSGTSSTIEWWETAVALLHQKGRESVKMTILGELNQTLEESLHLGILHL